MLKPYVKTCSASSLWVGSHSRSDVCQFVLFSVYMLLYCIRGKFYSSMMSQRFLFWPGNQLHVLEDYQLYLMCKTSIGIKCLLKMFY